MIKQETSTFLLKSLHFLKDRGLLGAELIILNVADWSNVEFCRMINQENIYVPVATTVNGGACCT